MSPSRTPPQVTTKKTNNKENATIFTNHLQSVHQTHKDIVMDHQHKQEVDTWAREQVHLFNQTQTPQTLDDSTAFLSYQQILQMCSKP